MKYYKINILHDNFIWLLEKDSKAIIIDCGEAGPVLKFLKDNKFELTHVLLTHAHEDHIGGVKDIKDFTNAKVVANKITKKFIGCSLIDITITNEAYFNINNNLVKPIFTPGHSEDHMMYYFPNIKSLFTGDTLFTLGCGRAFFDIKLLFKSLQKVVNLIPKDTLIFPGHNYLKDNLSFISSLNYFTLINKNSLYTELIEIPTSLQIEMNYNPFLNYNNQEFKLLLNKLTLNDFEFFKYLRELKNNF